MDPLSILSAVLTVTKTTYWISSSLVNFIQSSRAIDKTLEELNREVEGLTQALESIELSLKDPAISRVKSGGDVKGPWGSLDVAVTDTQRTVNALKGIVEGLGTVKRTSILFKKAMKQVKLNLNADQISGVKDRIHTHTTSLRLALQTATLLISCQSSEGIQSVERLIKAMHLNVESSRKNSTDERLPTKFRNPDLLKHTEQLISSASTILGSKSTTSGGSEMRFPHSENGQPLDRGQKATIEDWIPHLASMEEEPTQTSDHHDNSATSDTLVGADGFNIEEVQSTDSDSDDDYDIAKKCFERAKKEFSLDQHAKAMEFFRAGLKRAEKVGLKKKARLELRTIQMKMGLSLLSLGELSKSEQCFLSLAWPQTTDEKSKILALHASSGLAVICLCKGSFDEAEDWCNKSRIGWRRIAGKEHTAYITCLRLSAFSSELNGNHAEAAAIEELANESNMAPGPVDTESALSESLGFTIEKSRTLVTEYHKRAPHTIRKEPSTQSERPSPAQQPESKRGSPAQQAGSDLMNGPPAQILAESPIKPKSGTTTVGSLHDAARAGDIALIKKLLENGANTDEEEKSKGNATALTLAAERGHKPVVECLLDRGANIEAKDNDGYTALIEAAYSGHKSIVEYLLDCGANIEAKNTRGDTALAAAAWYGQKSIVECLLDRGADIEARNSYGETPLLTACHCINEDEMKPGTVPTIELLCHKGADVSVRDDVGNSPLKRAREVKDSKLRKELVGVLKKYGAKE